MEFLESILVALFTITVVFAVLALLYVIIRLFSLIIGAIEAGSKKPVLSTINKPATAVIPVAATVTAGPVSVEEDFSSGSLKLKNIDESSAAMVMAIVSDESGIPLSELCFKSIRLINE